MDVDIVNVITQNILEIVFAVISAIVSYYVIPFIKNDLIPFLKEKRLYNDVKTFVKAAEKLAESGVITRKMKKAKVIELLENKGVVVTDEIDAIIESAVKDLDLATGTVYEFFNEEEENE